MPNRKNRKTVHVLKWLTGEGIPDPFPHNEKRNGGKENVYL